MGNKTKSTQSASPWEPATDALKGGLSSAQDLYNSGGFNINPYQGDWVANADPSLTAGQDGILGALSGQAGGYSTAANAITGIAGMDVQRPDAANFNFDPQRQNVIDSIMPSINSSFAGSGMTGSSLHQQNLAKGLSSGLADAEIGFRDQEMRANAQNFGQYEALMGQKMQAAGMTPSMMDAQLNPFREMIGIGQQRQGQNQAEIDANIQSDLIGQSSQANALKDYMALISGIASPYGTQQATQSTSMGPLGIIGGIAQGASLFG